MSEKVTLARQCFPALAVDTNVIGEVIKLLFLFNSYARHERCNPAEALDTATAYFDPT